MNISHVIGELERLKLIHGDLEVKWCDDFNLAKPKIIVSTVKPIKIVKILNGKPKP